MENRRAVVEDGRWEMEERLLDLAILLSLCGVTLHAAVDFPLQIASLQLVAVALLGIAWQGPAMNRIHAKRESEGDVEKVKRRET